MTVVTGSPGSRLRLCSGSGLTPCARRPPRPAPQDHFNYLLGRQWTGRERAYPQAENLVELVDAALAAGDRATAASHLTLQGGHGTLSSGWRVDASLQPWDEGRSLFDLLGRGAVRVGGEASDVLSWEVSIGATRWCVYESSCRSTTELEQLLTSTSCISRL